MIFRGLVWLAVGCVAASAQSSNEREKRVTESVLAEIRRQTRPANIPEASAYVERVGRLLTAQLPESRFTYRFEVVEHPEAREPGAAPGGYVFVPVRWFITAQNEAEFAGMLAHAIAHIELPLKVQEPRPGAASIPLIYMGGPLGLHVETSGSSLVPHAFASTQRESEVKADRIAAEILVKAGLGTDGLRAYLGRTVVRNAIAVPPIAERLSAIAASSPVMQERAADPQFATARDAVKARQPEARRQAPTLRR